MRAVDHVIAAFTTARSERPELHRAWNATSAIGAYLPGSTLAFSAQRVGELDLLVRSMEATCHADAAGGSDFAFHYQVMLSEVWVGRVSEVFETINRTKRRPQTAEWNAVARDVNALRVAIEKHQIADDERATIETVRHPPQEGDEPELYDGSDPLRWTIPPRGASPRGSLMWLVIDIRKKQSRWIERQDLSDRVQRLWSMSKAPTASGA